MPDDVSSSMPFSGRFVLSMIDYAASAGLNKQELLQMTKLSEDELCQEDSIVSDSAYHQLIDIATSQTGDEFLGLHAAESMDLSAAGLIAQITQTSRTVREALEYCRTFANLGCSSLPMNFRITGSKLHIILEPQTNWQELSPVSFQQTVMGVLSFTLREIQSLTRDEFQPECIELPWAQPGNTSELNRTFGPNLKFNSNLPGLILPSSILDVPVISADYDLLRVLVAFAEKRSARLNPENSFSQRVRNSIFRLVRVKFPTIDEMAAHLNMSVRSFQRKLKDENTSYKQLLDDIRFEFAKDYLNRGNLSIGDVSYLLHYSEPAAFIRSFKRWTGQTPEAYREQLASR